MYHNIAGRHIHSKKTIENTDRCIDKSLMSAGKHKTRCCVAGCINTLDNSPGLRFYRFPNATIFSYKQKRRNDWIAAVSRKNPDGADWQPHNNTRICSKHFVGNEKSEDPRSPSYNPTIFPIVNNEAPICDPRIDRCTRARKRKAEEKPQRSTNRKIKKCTITSSNEDALYNTVKQNESQSRDKTVIQNHQKKMHQEVQVDFLQEKSSRVDHEACFTCNRYIYIDANTNKYGSMSDVELQIYIPEATTIKRIIIEKPKTVNQSCGNRVNSPDKDIYSLLKCTTGFNGATFIKEDRVMLDLAGVTLPAFRLLLKILPETREKQISKENQLLLFLFKMKIGLSYSALSVLFGIRKSTATKIFISTLRCLAVGAKQFVIWPSKEIIQATMPETFKKTYSNFRVIIDCMEFKVQQPSSVAARVNFYSHHRKRLTLKVLIGCTPSGAISYISKCHGGRTTNAQIASSAQFLGSLETDDVVLADKQFSQIETKLNENGRGVLLVIPPVFRNNDSCADQDEDSYRVLSVRKLFKRNIQKLRTFRILKEFGAKMLPYCDEIVFVCCVLVNLQHRIVKEWD